MASKSSSSLLSSRSAKEDSSYLSPIAGASVESLQERNRFLEDTRRAIFNVLEDVANSEKELEQKTEELEKFRQAVDASFDHVVISDVNGRILYANRAAEMMTGYSRQEIIGNTPALWGKQMPKEFYGTLWHTIKVEKSGYAGELTNRRKDGTKYLSSLRITPILDEVGEIKFFVGIERDISEERKSQLKIVRHAAELELANAHIAEEKERTESILRFLRSIGEGVYATDSEGKIIFMNESAEMMIGKPLESVLGKVSREVVDFIHVENEEAHHLDVSMMALHEKKIITIPRDTVLVRHGKEISVAGTCSLIRDEKQDITGTIVVFQDATKRRELDQMKDGFLSVAAHQLRTPLGSMRWSMELLLGGDLGRLPKEARETIEQIYENSQRMIVLVNDLLNVSRIDQNKGREEKVATDLRQMLEAVVETMRPEGEKRGVTLILKHKGKPLPKVMIPPKHFYEAFENLISNGIKYNKKPGSVIVLLSREDGGIGVTVTDTGIGIPKDAQSKIFSKFFRAPNAVLKETEGSGLGLSVVKSYLEAAGATIRFETEENFGTTFFIHIPEK